VWREKKRIKLGLVCTSVLCLSDLYQKDYMNTPKKPVLKLSRMLISSDQFSSAVDAGILTSAQVHELRNFCAASSPLRFDFAHLLFYSGGFLAIGAVTLFMTLGWEEFGGWGIFVASGIFMALSLYLRDYFDSQNKVVPAGLCVAFTTSITPLAIYGLEHVLGFWSHNSSYRSFHRSVGWSYLPMELCTLLVGTLLLWMYRYPITLLPLCTTLAYMSVDGAAFFGVSGSLVSLYMGSAMTGLALAVEKNANRGGDYSFWVYLFGVCMLWIGLGQNIHQHMLIWLICNCVFLVAGVCTSRRIFTVCGCIGCGEYFLYLARIYMHSWLLPVVLTMTGVGIMYIGSLYQESHNNSHCVQTHERRSLRALYPCHGTNGTTRKP